MPTIAQKIDILFKKYITYKSMVNIAGGSVNTLTANNTPYFLESYSSKPVISAEQIWTESKKIPIYTNHLNKSLLLTQQDLRNSGPYIDTIDNSDPNRPIVLVNNKKLYQRLDLEFDFVSGSKYAWKYKYLKGSTEWINDFGPINNFINYNIIPFSFEESGTIYRYELYSGKSLINDMLWNTTYTLTNQVQFGFNDWFFDPDSSGLILNFLNETLPTGVTTSTTLYLRCYRYIGDLGLFSQNSKNFNWSYWQDPVIDIVDTLPIAPIDGARYILGQNISPVDVYDILIDNTTTTIVQKNTIVQYWDNTIHQTTNGGWIVIQPDYGMFTSINSFNNNIIKWNGVDWVELNWSLSTDFKIQSPINTTQNGEDAGLTPLIDIPAGNVSVCVKVNGIDIIVGNGCNETTFLNPQWEALFAKPYTFTSAINNTIILNTTHDININDSLIITDNGIITCYNVINVSGLTLTISGNVLGPVTEIMHVKKWGKITQGDKLLWFGSYANYQLNTDDIITFKYITKN